MGQMYRFTCPDCQRFWTLRLGHGLMHATLKHVLREFPAEIQKEILNGGGQLQEGIFDFQYEAAECSRCGELLAIPVLRSAKDDVRYTIKCPVCGNAPVIHKDIESIPCPGCRSARLVVKNTGFWD